MQLYHVSSRFRRHSKMLSNNGDINVYLVRINIIGFELILLSYNMFLYYNLSEGHDIIKRGPLFQLIVGPSLWEN